MQQALLAHALDGDIVYSTPTLGTLASSITNGLMGSCLRYPFLACCKFLAYNPPLRYYDDYNQMSETWMGYMLTLGQTLGG